MRLILSYWKQGIILDRADQASHLCPNEDKQMMICCNPNHMTSEYDKDNKARQRCQGWILDPQLSGSRGGGGVLVSKLHAWTTNMQGLYSEDQSPKTLIKMEEEGSEEEDQQVIEILLSDDD